MTRRFECHLIESNENLPPILLVDGASDECISPSEKKAAISQSITPTTAPKFGCSTIFEIPIRFAKRVIPVNQWRIPSHMLRGKAAVDFSSPLLGSYLAQSTLWSNPPSRIANLVQVVDTILHLKLGGLSLVRGDTLSHAEPSFTVMPGILSKTSNLYSDELMCLGVETLLTVPPTLHLDICVFGTRIFVYWRASSIDCTPSSSL